MLKSFLKLKQGSTDYADIMANAMDATDNILSLKSTQSKVGDKSSNAGSTEGKIGKASKVGQAGKGKASQNNAKAILSILDKYTNKGTGGTIATWLPHSWKP